MITRPEPSTLLLGAACGLSPFGMAIVVPSMQGIADQYASDYAVVQFVVSAYLFGLALSQPIVGFLCDQFGRRPVMLWGFAIFVVASMACAFSGSLEELITFRFLQAVGVGVGTVSSRAIIQDTRGADGAAETMSYIAAAMGLAPVVAPLVGGWLLAYGGLRSIFLCSAFIGLLVLIRMFLHLPETLPPALEKPRWSAWVRSYGQLVRSPPFIGYTLMFGFVQGSFFSFLAVGAAIFQDNFGIGPQAFGLIWGLMAFAYVAGAAIGGRSTARFGASRILSIGVALTLVFGWLLLLAVAVTGVKLMSVVIPMLFLMAAAGSVTPNALASAVSQHPTLAGTSSGLSSALGIVVGGMFTIVSGWVYQGNFLAVAGLITFASTMTAVSWLIVRHYQQTQQEATT